MTENSLSFMMSIRVITLRHDYMCPNDHRARAPGRLSPEMNAQNPRFGGGDCDEGQ